MLTKIAFVSSLEMWLSCCAYLIDIRDARRYSSMRWEQLWFRVVSQGNKKRSVLVDKGLFDTQRQNSRIGNGANAAFLGCDIFITIYSHHQEAGTSTNAR
ncbi:hypothetical protein IWW34DRAFT_413878 [Fusarium oxysporum f. sp. albedinis]|nr:hypothetical protein IWW34DRAFT_413878 [Fusarium oxysporum f. sp. albedinis]